MYYLNLNDKEVEEKILTLTHWQKEKFEEALINSPNPGATEDRRRALFVASSYPLDQTE